jgi:RNA polymerase primary sigma factor
MVRDKIIEDYFKTLDGPLLSSEEEVALAKKIESHYGRLLYSLCEYNGSDGIKGLSLLKDKVKMSYQRKKDNTSKDHSLSAILSEEISRKNILNAAEDLLSESVPEQKDNYSKRLENNIRNDLRLISEYRNRFTEKNLRLVISLAKKYRNIVSNFMDLIQGGNIGLMETTDNFNHNFGYRFSTFARWGILHELNKEIINQTRTIRLPRNTERILNNYKRIHAKLTAEFGEVTNEEIAKLMGMKVNILERYLDSPKEPLSLSMVIKNDKENNNHRLMDIVENTKSPNSYEVYEQKEIKEHVSELLSTLNPRERRIIKMRFGIDDEEEKEHTLKEIHWVFEVSEERIRQIESRALEKLRDSYKRGTLESTVF